MQACALIPICRCACYKSALAVALDVDQTCQQYHESLATSSRFSAIISTRSKSTRISWYYAAGATMPGQGSKAAHRVDRRFGSKFQIVSGFLLTLVVSLPLSWPSRAQMGSVRVVFTKVGLIGGAGAGQGILTYRGREYPFRVSGLSLGIAVGASTRVSYLQDPRDFPGISMMLSASAAR